MSLPPNQPPWSSVKPKVTREERRARQADRLTTIRLRMLIGRELDERGITTPAAIGAALSMPPAEAVKLLTGINGVRAMWRFSPLPQPGWGCRPAARRHAIAAGTAIGSSRHGRAAPFDTLDTLDALGSGQGEAVRVSTVSKVSEGAVALLRRALGDHTAKR